MCYLKIDVIAVGDDVETRLDVVLDDGQEVLKIVSEG